jgi:D-alanyl-D-alanine carboxypeptidase-like protein/putative peptidoglycan binding protein
MPKRKLLLSPKELARALVANPSYARRLSWDRYTDAIATLIRAPSAAPDDPAFALAVAAWQARHGLDVDGILGPDTWSAIRADLVAPDVLTPILPDAPPVPDGEEAILQTFGDPRPLLDADGNISKENLADWERQILARGQLPFPVPLSGGGVKERFYAHRLLVGVFEATFREVSRLGLQGEIHTWGGIYNFRPIRGRRRLSLHAFGAAIDLNPETNALHTPGDMSPRVVEVFAHFGFLWGGHFRSRPDPMHFQYATGY